MISNNSCSFRIQTCLYALKYYLSFADNRAEEAVAVPHQSFNQVRDEASGGA